MIAKAKACVGGTSLIGYVVNNKKGYELERNHLSGEKPSELYRSMQVIQNQNLRCKNNTISIVLSPEKSDGQKLTDEQWRTITKKFIKELGIGEKEAQYISFIHTEKEHKHLHLILNRVNDDGTLIKDNFIGKRAQYIGHRIAKEMNLISAKEEKAKNENNLKTELKSFRKLFKQAHESIKKLLPSNIQEYTELMQKHNFNVIPYINKQGKVQGYKIGRTDTDKEIKLSQIDRKIKLDDEFFKTLSYEKQQKYDNFEESIIKLQPSFTIRR